MKKNTRSRARATQLLHHASMTWNILSESMILLLLTTRETSDVNVLKSVITNFVVYIDIFFIKEHKNREWYRPEMAEFKNQMKNTSEQLYSQIPHAFTSSQRTILKKFMDTV